MLCNYRMYPIMNHTFMHYISLMNRNTKDLNRKSSTNYLREQRSTRIMHFGCKSSSAKDSSSYTMPQNNTSPPQRALSRATLLDMVLHGGSKRKIHQLIQHHSVNDTGVLQSWSKWFVMTVMSMSYLTVCAVASPTVAPISWEEAWALTVDYSAPTSDVTDFLSGLGNAFNQSASTWNQPEIGNHTDDTLLTLDGILKSVKASDDSSKKINVVEEAVSLMTTLAIANVQYSDEDEPFTAKVSDVSIFAQTVTSSTTISIPNSTATVGIPQGLCDAPDECVVVFIAMGNDLTASTFDDEALISRVYTINLHSYGLRRILTEDDFSSLSICTPFLFTIPIEGNVNISKYDDKDGIEETYYFPVCQFWDTENATWSQTGCWVSSFTETTVTCACTHLASFSGSADDFIPSANVKALWTWRSLNVVNLMEHPSVFLCILPVLSLFISICVSTPDKHNKPMLAFEDSIFESYKNRRFVGRHTSLELTEIKYLETILPTNSKMMIGMGMRKVFRGAIYAMVKLQMALFILYLKNEHTLLSIFQRSAGTNYTTKQRMSCFFVYLSTLMAVSAVFYGVNQQGVSIVAASAIMSVVAVAPGRIFKKLFIKSKPKEIKSRKITQMIFHLKPDLELIESSRSQTYKKVLDMVSNKEEEIKWETLYSFQSDYKEERSADAASGRGEIDWNEMTLINQIRNRLLDETFPYPHFMKKLTWTLLLIWCLAMIVIALHYGIQFDLLYEIVETKAVPDCWENNFREKLNNRFTEIYIENKQNSAATDYGWDYLTDSRAWLISLCGSLAFSTFLWQPITIWLMTWMKLWAFSHNLKLDSGPSNMCHLMAIVCCCRCCGCLDALKRRQEKKEMKRNNEHFGDAASETGIGESMTETLTLSEMLSLGPQPIQQGDGVVTATVSGIDMFRITDIADRPLDVYQFYGSRELLVNDVDTDLFVQHFPIDDEEEPNDWRKAHRVKAVKYNQKEMYHPLHVVLEEQEELKHEPLMAAKQVRKTYHTGPKGVLTDFEEAKLETRARRIDEKIHAEKNEICMKHGNDSDYTAHHSQVIDMSEEFSDEASGVERTPRNEEEEENTPYEDIAEVELTQQKANDGNKDENQEMAKQDDRWKAKPNRTRHSLLQDQTLESILQSIKQ